MKLTILPNYLTVLYMPENPVNLARDFFFFFPDLKPVLRNRKLLYFPPCYTPPIATVVSYFSIEIL